MPRYLKNCSPKGVELHALAVGTGIKGNVENQILPYGVDKLFVFDGEGLYPYTSAPHTDIMVKLFQTEQPQICLMGATVIGRDLGPRVSSSLTSGLAITTTAKPKNTMTICFIKSDRLLAATSWPPSSTPTIVHKWLPCVRE